MPKHVRRITDQALLSRFEEALARGAMSLSAACRIARAKAGVTQAEFAARAGVALKVIKQLEGGHGNPRLESIEGIAAAAGMRLALVPPGASVRLGSVDRYVRRQSAARRAGLRAICRGKTSLKRQHARNALRGSDFTIELPPLTRSMRNSLPPLSVRDVAELLERSPRSREAVLVGGQALNVWAVHYGLATQTAAVSDGIDFFGTRADAIAAVLDWGGDVNMPSRS